MGKLVTAVLWWIAIHQHQAYSSYFGKLCLVQLSRPQNNLTIGKYGYNPASVQKRRKKQHWLYFASTKLLLLAPYCKSFTRIKKSLWRRVLNTVDTAHVSPQFWLKLLKSQLRTRTSKKAEGTWEVTALWSLKAQGKYLVAYLSFSSSSSGLLWNRDHCPTVT